METHHTAYFKNSVDMSEIKSESIDLVVTSPPYPMIEMWDDSFSELNPEIRSAIDANDGNLAFELMHKQLDPVWQEMFRVVREGGFVCVNIGDATRSIGGDFGLYSNHVRILNTLIASGFTPLPCVIWRKQTNAPNKFMGSGTLPSGAYVTLEHEYILILRKGSKRVFDDEDVKQKRRESAMFWEERNTWYSDVWMDIKGTTQGINDKEARKRSAAFPFELAYRLINMYSIQGDTVLDPFLGTGTTCAAAMASGRNSAGYEIDSTLKGTYYSTFQDIVAISNGFNLDRIRRHLQFVAERINSGKLIKHTNGNYGFAVVTAFEQDLLFRKLQSVEFLGNNMIKIKYAGKLDLDSGLKDIGCSTMDTSEQSPDESNSAGGKTKKPKKGNNKHVQLNWC